MSQKTPTLREAEEDEEDIVYFNVPLDLKTVAWLMAVCEGAHAPPAAVISSILRDIRIDDEASHDMAATAPAPHTLQ